MSRPIDRDRLRKLLALMGSDQDGEALSAARLAHALVAKSGLGWSDLIPDMVNGDSTSKPRQTDQDREQLDALIAAESVSSVLKIRLRAIRLNLRAGQMSEEDRRFVRLLHRKAALDGAFASG